MCYNKSTLKIIPIIKVVCKKADRSAPVPALRLLSCLGQFVSQYICSFVSIIGWAAENRQISDYHKNNGLFKMLCEF